VKYREGTTLVDNIERAALTEAVYYILLALHEPMHGYGIMQYVKDISNQRVVLGPGTLYGAMNTMQTKGWIEAMDTDTDSRKKEYRITAAGRRVVCYEIERLEELLTNGKKVIGGRVS
jgi:DNA-binding PadR family transcriptional regulator